MAKIVNKCWKNVIQLFIGATISYIDNHMMGINVLTLQKTYSWYESDNGFIISSFQATYAIGLLITGPVKN